MNIAGMCKAFNVLPSAGGLFDQTPATVKRLQIVLDVMNKREELELEKSKRGSQS